MRINWKPTKLIRIENKQIYTEIPQFHSIKFNDWLYLFNTFAFLQSGLEIECNCFSRKLKWICMLCIWGLVLILTIELQSSALRSVEYGNVIKSRTQPHFSSNGRNRCTPFASLVLLFVYFVFLNHKLAAQVFTVWLIYTGAQWNGLQQTSSSNEILWYVCVCVKERKRFRGIDLHFQGVKLEANFSRLFMSIYLPFDALFHTPQIATRCQYSLHAACEEEYLNMVCTYTQKKIVSLPYSFGSNEYREVQSIDVVSTSSAAQPPYSLDKFGTSDICIFSAHNK